MNTDIDNFHLNGGQWGIQSIRFCLGQNIVSVSQVKAYTVELAFTIMSSH